MVAVLSVSSIKLPKKALVIVEEISKKTNEQLDRGFLWIEKLVDELENFDRQRDRYPKAVLVYFQFAD